MPMVQLFLRDGFLYILAVVRERYIKQELDDSTEHWLSNCSGWYHHPPDTFVYTRSSYFWVSQWIYYEVLVPYSLTTCVQYAVHVGYAIHESAYHTHILQIELGGRFPNPA